MILFSIFHLLGMSTTITNPILYGFLNENITAEIHAFGSQIIPISKNYLKVNWEFMDAVIISHVM